MRENRRRRSGERPADLELHGALQIDAARAALGRELSDSRLASLLDIFRGREQHISATGWRARRAKGLIVRSLQRTARDETAPEALRIASTTLREVMTRKKNS